MSAKLVLTIAIFTFTLQSHALTPELQDSYNIFRLNYTSVFNPTVSKENYLDYFRRKFEELTISYNKFEKLEGPEELSPQGNQMALDLEMLEPLNLIAQSGITKENCIQAIHMNNLSQSSSHEIFQKVDKILKLLCK